MLSKYKYRSKKALVKRIYNHQRSSSKTRNHPMPSYTREELKNWLYSKPKFHLIFDNWKRLDFQSEYRPSVDRVDDSLHYTMSNIQLMTWGENKAKAYSNRVAGTDGVGKAVLQFSLEGELLGEYPTTQSASRVTKVSASSIVKCCKGKLKTAGKTIWEYK